MGSKLETWEEESQTELSTKYPEWNRTNIARGSEW